MSHMRTVPLSRAHEYFTVFRDVQGSYAEEMKSAGIFQVEF